MMQQRFVPKLFHTDALAQGVVRGNWAKPNIAEDWSFRSFMNAVGRAMKAAPVLISSDTLSREADKAADADFLAVKKFVHEVMLAPMSN